MFKKSGKPLYGLPLSPNGGMGAIFFQLSSILCLKLWNFSRNLGHNHLPICLHFIRRPLADEILRQEEVGISMARVAGFCLRSAPLDGVRRGVGPGLVCVKVWQQILPVLGESSACYRDLPHHYVLPRPVWALFGEIGRSGLRMMADARAGVGSGVSVGATRVG